MTKTTYWGGWVLIGGNRWWLCDPDGEAICLYAEDGDGAPGVRIAADSMDDLAAILAERGCSIVLRDVTVEQFQ